MARPRTIVGIGEIRVSDNADGAVAVGLAADVARAASRIGHVGIAVSRVGQDRFADDVLASLASDGVNTSHLQSDPDYSTGRVLNPHLSRLDGDAAADHAAYANLQWDYDLVDLAQSADVVIFGACATHNTQARSVIQQFLYECRAALRIIDLTNRDADSERGSMLALATDADVAILDTETLDYISPATSDQSVEQRVRRLLREASLNLIVLLDDTQVHVHARDETWNAPLPSDGLNTASLLRFIVALLDGIDMPTSIATLTKN